MRPTNALVLQVIAWREERIAQIERAGEELRRTGQVDAWFAEADPHVREVCAMTC